MGDKPIIFSGPMVRAILDGRKTQTRRVLKPQPAVLKGATPFYQPYPTTSPREFHCCLGEHTHNIQIVKYAPGDRLWCREAWKKVPRTAYWHDSTVPHQESGDWWAVYREGWERCAPRPWTPSIHMPRWASRLTLDVTAVKVERLQEISEEDAKAEGPCLATDDGRLEPTYRLAFTNLWQGINAKREGCRWEDNPWVVAVTFRPILANIDSLENPNG